MKKVLICFFSILVNISFCFSQNTEYDLFEILGKSNLNTLVTALEKNIDVNVKDENGNTPLMLTAAENDWMAFVTLYSYGAKTDIVNNKGETAEMIARNSKSEDVISFFDNEELTINKYKCITGNSNTIKLFNLNRYKDGENNAEAMVPFCLSCFGEKHPDYASSLYNLSFVYDFLGDSEKALPFILKSLEILELDYEGNSLDYANGIELLSGIYKRMSDYKNAEINLKKAASIYKETLGDSHALYFRNLINQASFYSEIGKYKEAFNLNQFVLDNINEDYKYIYVFIVGNMAQLYLKMGNYEAAESFFVKCGTIIEKDFGKENVIYETHLNNISSLYHDKGLYDKSIQILLETKRGRRDKLGENHPDYAITLSNLGNVYSDLGQFDKALQLFEESKTIRKSVLGENHSDYARSLVDIGGIYAMKKDYDKALFNYKESLFIIKETYGENHGLYAKIFNRIGMLYSKMGEKKEALVVLNEGLKMNLEIFGEDHFTTSSNLSRLAKVYQEIGNYEESNIKYKKALKIKKKFVGEKSIGYVNDILNLAKNNELLGKEKKSIHLTNDALNLYMKNITINSSVLNENDIIQYLNRINIQTSILESRIFRGRNKKSIKRINKNLYNLKLQTKTLAFINNKKTRSSIAKDTLNKTYDKYQILKYQYSKACLLTESKRNKRGLNLEQIKRELDDLETELTLKYRDGNHNKNVLHEDLVKSLNQEAVIDFTHFRYHGGEEWTDSILYGAYLTLPRSNNPIFIPLAEEKEIQKLLKEAIGTKNGMSYIESREIGKKLYHLIFSPLEKHLKGIKTIRISASGILHRVAFHALQKDTQLLMDSYDIHYHGTMRDFIFNKNQNKKTNIINKNIALFGNPDFNASLEKIANEEVYYIDSTWATRSNRDGFYSLPETKIEVESIEKYAKNSLWKTNTKLGILATEGSFKSLSGKKVNVIHLATHGYALKQKEETKEEIINIENNNKIAKQKNPLFRSGLALSGGNTTWKSNTFPETEEDGLLSAYEISMMNLFGTDLVVLSACDTGLGDILSGEGVLGLQRAFKTAGVKNLIVSLWKVDDKATRILMEKFYKHYFEGKDAHESLKLAQGEMRKGEYSDAKYWAGFILIQ